MRSSSARLLALAAAVATLVLVAALSGSEPRPYVVTAIDYHFHDAHPTLPIGPGRDLIVRNQGRNLHNVTIPALGFSRDVRPGGEVVIRLDRGPARTGSLRALLPDPPGGVRDEGRDRHLAGVSREDVRSRIRVAMGPDTDRRAEEPLDPLTPSPYASVVYSVPRPVKRWPQATRTPGNRRLLHLGGTLSGTRAPSSDPLRRRRFPPPGPSGRSGPERNVATCLLPVNAMGTVGLQGIPSDVAGSGARVRDEERVT